MDDFARLSSDDRRTYLEQAAGRLKLTPQIIEKDFWVCWCLKRLFSLEEFKGHLTFKGGTSLSKVYHVIERFSEDVDVSIERTFLGFGGDHEPEAATSGKEQQHRIEKLKAKCQEVIAERLEPQLRDAIALLIPEKFSWNLTRDPADADAQTLLFQYPAAITSGLSPYFASAVKIELGARSDHFPVEFASIFPALWDAFPEALTDRHCHVRVLGAERTFWEKTTILHSLHHASEKRRLRPAMSRHYYDVFRLAKSPIFDRAMQHIELLSRVAEHKSVFFKAAWANYHTAHPGTLRLSPHEAIADILEKDYLEMQSMFFREPPPFREILSFLADVENRINQPPL